MDFRSLLHELTELTETTVQVGTTRVWGGFKYQKQRNGQWLKLRKARPDELTGPPKGSPVVTPPIPTEKRRVPSVSPVDIPVKKEWRDSVSDLPENTTDEMFNEKGSPRPQRKALHERIYRTFLDHVDTVPLEKKPVAVVLMGAPASGRSAAGKALAATGLFVRSDPGLVATMFPEYSDGVKALARNAAKLVSKEAGYVARSLMDLAVEDRKNVVLDTFGKHFSKMSGIVSEFQESDYYVVVVFLETEVEVAKSRAVERGAKNGLWVPETALRASTALLRVFERLDEIADQTLVFDTNGSPKLKESVLGSLRLIFERREPKNIAVSLAEIQKVVLEGLKRERSEMENKPDKYTDKEGLWLAHYDDIHLVPIDDGEDEEEPKEPEAEPEIPEPSGSEIPDFPV